MKRHVVLLASLALVASCISGKDRGVDDDARPAGDIAFIDGTGDLLVDGTPLDGSISEAGLPDAIRLDREIADLNVLHDGRPDGDPPRDGTVDTPPPADSTVDGPQVTTITLSSGETIELATVLSESGLRRPRDRTDHPLPRRGHRRRLDGLHPRPFLSA